MNSIAVIRVLRVLLKINDSEILLKLYFLVTNSVKTEFFLFGQVPINPASPAALLHTAGDD